jgi:hypothetical protein
MGYLSSEFKLESGRCERLRSGGWFFGLELSGRINSKIDILILPPGWKLAKSEIIGSAGKN